MNAWLTHYMKRGASFSACGRGLYLTCGARNSIAASTKPTLVTCLSCQGTDQYKDAASGVTFNPDSPAVKAAEGVRE